MPPTLVQSKTLGSTGNVTSLQVTLDATPTQGNLLILIAAADATIATPSGWTLSRSAVDASGHYQWHKLAGPSESATVTITPSGSAGTVMAVYEYSGMVTSTPLDVVASNTPGGTGQTSVSTGTTAATAQAVELVVASAAEWDVGSPTATWTAGYTNRGTVVSTAAGHNIALHMATLITAATGAQTATATFTDASSRPSGVITTYKAASGTTLSAAASGASTSDGSATASLTMAATASGASTSTGTGTATMLMATSAAGASTSAGTANATLVGPRQAVTRPDTGTVDRPFTGTVVRP